LSSKIFRSISKEERDREAGAGARKQYMHRINASLSSRRKQKTICLDAVPQLNLKGHRPSLNGVAYCIYFRAILPRLASSGSTSKPGDS
jgi:hypothetical protein